MFFFYLYYDVPICARCGSNHTGMYIKSNISEFWIIKWFLRRGQYVLFKNTITDNCFCGNCGIEWTQDIPIKLITRKQLKRIKIEKGINEAKENINTYQKEMNEKKKYDEKLRKKEKKRNKLTHKAARKIVSFTKNISPFRKDNK